MWLLVDPSVRPRHHPVGRVFGLGAVWDSWSSSEALRALSEVGAPEAHADVGVRRRLEDLRARGVRPLVRVVFWYGTHFVDSWGPDLERWGRLAYGLDPMPGGTSAAALTPRAGARETVRGGKGGLPTASSASSSRRDRSPTQGATWRELAAFAELAVRLKSSDPGVVGRRIGQLVAAGEWDVVDYLRIRSAELVRVPPDTAVLVDRLDLDPSGRDVVSAGAAGLAGLGRLPALVVGHQSSSSLHARMCRFDPEPVMVVVLRAQLRRCPLPKGLVVAVGRVRHRPTASADVGVVEGVPDDPEVVALRRRLLHRVLVEPPQAHGTEQFTLWPPGRSEPESRHAG